MERLLGIFILHFLLLTGSRCQDDILEVSTHLHGTVTLPCAFNFIHVPEGLTVSWVKKSPDMVVHSFQNEGNYLTDQDPQFTGRTEMSSQVSKGKVDLTLKNIGFDDEGIYSCGASNKRGHGDIYFRISVDKLHAADPVVMIHSDGKKNLKCSSVGLYKDPRIEWQNQDLEDVSQSAKLSITNQSDGLLLVESILDIDVKPNEHYFCHVKEGRLKRSARAVVSDGEHAIKIKDDL